MTDGQISSEGSEVFISYSHKDEILRDELEKHLTILKRQKLISTWFDRKIGAEEEWKRLIDEHLNTAHNLVPYRSISKAILFDKRLIYG